MDIPSQTNPSMFTTDPAIPQPPSRQEQAQAIVERAMDHWKAQHAPGLESDDQTRMIVARVPTWVAPASVVAGVTDIMSTVRIQGSRLDQAQIEQLGNELATQLREAGLLAAVPRRGGPLTS